MIRKPRIRWDWALAAWTADGATLLYLNFYRSFFGEMFPPQ